MKNVLLRSVLLALFIISCSDTTTIFETETDGFSTETDPKVLERSMDFSRVGVLDMYEEQNAVIGNSRFQEPLASSYPLSLVARVSAPSISSSVELTATHVDVDGEYVYVSYHATGAPYGGAIDIIDVSNPVFPNLSARLSSQNVDFNAIKYHNGALYVVGGIDSEQSAIATANSLMLKIGAVNGNFDLNTLEIIFQEGFTANDIAIDGNSVFVTSGKEGYVSEYDASSMELRNEAPFSDLRSVASKNGTNMVLDASTGVRILDSNLQETAQIAIDSDFRTADRRTLDFMDNRILVAEGRKGTGVYDATTGTLQEYIPISVNPNGVVESDIVTNATAFNEGVILMANGGAGLSVSEDEQQSINTVGVVELEGSINYVASKGDYIYAASGRNGLQIIKMNRPTPNLEAVCENAPEYTGIVNLGVRENESLAFSGTRRFWLVNVQGKLLLCGSWAIAGRLSIFEDAIFEVRGSLVTSRSWRPWDIVVGKNATFRMDGDFTHYGNIILEENATIEFVGNNNRVNVFGEVTIHETAQVIGEFDDLQNSF